MEEAYSVKVEGDPVVKTPRDICPVCWHLLDLHTEDDAPVMYHYKKPVYDGFGGLIGHDPDPHPCDCCIGIAQKVEELNQ